MTLTFVTAFMDIYGRVHNNKPNSMRFQHFKGIASTGIPIVLFIDQVNYDELLPELPLTHNVKFVIMNFEDFEFTKMTRSFGDLSLPPIRCMKKDTVEFMTLMHAKIECMVRTIQTNPFDTDHFAWMDFSLSYIFKDPSKSFDQLVWLSQQQFKSKLFVIPGCWSKGYMLDQMWERILWRFCGGFFLADRESLLYLYELYMEVYPTLLQESKRMVWETNVWAYLEEKNGWKPDWFSADHNDSMIYIPKEFILSS